MSPYQNFLDFGAQTAWEELHSLRSEKNNLLADIEALKVNSNREIMELKLSIKMKDDIIEVAKEEMDKLENNLMKLQEKNTKYKQQIELNANDINLLRNRVNELQLYRDESLVKTDLQNSSQLSLYRAELSRLKVWKKRGSNLDEIQTLEPADPHKYIETIETYKLVFFCYFFFLLN